MKKISKIARHALGLATLLMVPLILAACASPKPAPTKIVWWNVFDDPDSFKEIINKYEDEINVDIELVTMNYNDYESELIDALAAGRGPDIFTIHNTWLPEHRDKIAPLPTIEDYQKTMSEEELTNYEPRLEALMGLRQFTDEYVDVAARDFVSEDRIYAIPLYVDNLALYYNVDMLASAGYPKPPDTWEDFADMAGDITVVDEYNRVLRSGAAMGAAININRSTDVLTAIMIQSGATAVDGQRLFAAFDRQVERADGSKYNPGLEALDFYTSFAKSTSNNYSWNLDPDIWYSIDNFAAGNVGMMVNYSHQIQVIRDKNPKLNFAIAPLPQFRSSPYDLTYANYWGQTVSKTSKVQLEAWEFLNYLSLDENNMIYLDANQRPPAKRSLIKAYENDLDLGVFADQADTAKSFYTPDQNLTETVFARAIQDVITGNLDTETALQTAANQITQRLQSRQYPEIGI